MGEAPAAGTAATPRRGFNWPLVVFSGVVAGLGWMAGTLFDAGPAATLAATTALFVGFGASGGSLRADLRLLLAMAPAFVIAAAGPRWLAQFSPPGAVALLAVLILAAGVLPAQGPRWATVGKGLALTSVMGYALPLSHPATGAQLVTAAVAGVLAAVTARVLSGVADPGRPVREKVAAVLVTPGPDVAGALVAWLQDRPTAWLGQSLAAATAYRSLRTASPPVDPARALLDARAQEVAGLILARRPGSSGDDRDPTPLHGPASIALERAASAARARSGGLVPMPAGLGRRLVAAAWTAPLTWRSDLTRHAARTAFAVLMAGSLALALLPPGEPLLATLLMTTYGVLQSGRSETLTHAGQRVSGVAVGAVLASVAIWVAPASVLLSLSMAALVVGLGTRQTMPPVSYAAFVLVTVGMNVGVRHRDPEATLGGYLLLVALALAIGVVVAFAVVPGARPLHSDPATARMAVAESLETLSGGTTQRDLATDLRSVRDALRATHALDVAGDPVVGDRRLVDAVAALAGVAVLIAAGGAPGAAETIRAGAAVIRGERPAPQDGDATGLVGLFLRLAGDVAAGLDGVAPSRTAA